MSGRLIILPKKNYCPWNPQNLERVLRDERIEKERIETQKKNEQRRIKHDKIQKKKIRLSSDPLPAAQLDATIGSEISAQERHINLFCEEEAESRRCTIKSPIKDDTTHPGIFPVFLKDSVSDECKMHQCPFYLKRDRLGLGLDEKIKYNIDPMRDFHLKDQIMMNDVSAKPCKDDLRTEKSLEIRCDSSRTKTHRRRSKRRPELPKKRKNKSRYQSTTNRFKEMMKRQRSRADAEFERESVVRS